MADAFTAPVHLAGITDGPSNTAIFSEMTKLDGSVRFVKGSIPYPVWPGLATRAVGEIISPDAF